MEQLNSKANLVRTVIDPKLARVDTRSPRLERRFKKKECCVARKLRCSQEKTCFSHLNQVESIFLKSYRGFKPLVYKFVTF